METEVAIKRFRDQGFRCCVVLEHPIPTQPEILACAEEKGATISEEHGPLILVKGPSGIQDVYTEDSLAHQVDRNFGHSSQ